MTVVTEWQKTVTTNFRTKKIFVPKKNLWQQQNILKKKLLRKKTCYHKLKNLIKEEYYGHKNKTNNKCNSFKT